MPTTVRQRKCVDLSTPTSSCIAEDAKCTRIFRRRFHDNNLRPPLGPLLLFLRRRLLPIIMLLLTACSSGNCYLVRGVGALFVQSTPPISPSRRTRNILQVDISSNAGQTSSSSSTPSRRSALASLFGITTTITAAMLVGTTASASVLADDTVLSTDIINVDLSQILLRGTVTLRSNVVLLSENLQSTALYITARPDRPDNVPSAILDGTRGKAPPVLVARLPLASLQKSSDSNSNNKGAESGIFQLFPFEFTLTAADVTVEGQQQQQGQANTNTANTHTDYWWSRDDLIVSARLDSDGVAATRDPNDLVGRSTLKRKRSGADADEVVVVELQGRGVGGKFVTGKAAKK